MCKIPACSVGVTGPGVICQSELILCCFAMEGLAGEKSFGDRVPTEDELINALAPDPDSLPEGYKRRAIKQKSIRPI